MALTDSLEIIIGADLTEVEKALSGLTGKAKLAGQALGRAATVAMGIGAGMAGAFAAGGLALREALDAGSEMEAFESRLTTLMGSSEGARNRMAELFDFAATTPFELDQVVAAEVTMRGFGADTEALMTGLIDLAAGTGGDLNQLAIDFGKAWTQGAAGMESDIGRVLQAQMQARSDIKLTDMALEDFRALMQETLSEGMFAGGAAKLSQTFSGMVSNLKDEWSRFKLEVADAGVFDNVKEVLRDTLSFIGQNRDAIKEFAADVSGVLWFSFKAVAEVAAGIYDNFLLWKAALFEVGSVAANVDQLISYMGMHFVDTLIEVARVTNKDAVPALAEVAWALDNHAVAAGKTAEEMRAIAAESYNSANNAMKLAGYFNSIEKTSAAAADSTRDIATGGGTTSGEGDTKAKDAAAAALLKQFEAADAFRSDMAALDDTAFEQEQARYQERIDALAAYYDQNLITGQAYEDTLLAIETDHTLQQMALTQELADAREAARKKDLEEEKAANQAKIQLSASYASAAAGVFGSLAELQEAYGEENKGAQKKLLTAQALMSTYASAAMTASSVPFPFNLPLIAAAVGQGLAQVALIQKQHQGGVTMGYAPDEVPTTRLAGEASLSRSTTRAIGGEQGVNALEAGRGGGGVLQLRIGRVAQEEMIRTGLQGNGLLRQSMRQSRDQGLGAGISGLPVPA